MTTARVFGRLAGGGAAANARNYRSRRGGPPDDGLQCLPLLRGALRRLSGDGDAPRLPGWRPPLPRQSLPRLRRLLLRLPVLAAARVQRQCAARPGAGSRRLIPRLCLAGGGGCMNDDERPADRRKLYHHLTVYGFLLCFAATAVATLYHFLLGREAPYPWYDLPVVLGTLGGIGLVVGPAALLAAKWRGDPAVQDEGRRGMDVAFIAMLLMTGITGLALLVWRETPAMGPLLALHLGVVFGFFITMPYGKFVHGLYRFAALIRYAQERRVLRTREDQAEV